MKELFRIFAITFLVWLIISLPSILKLKNITDKNFKLTLPIEKIIKEKENISKKNNNLCNNNSEKFEDTNISFDMDLTKPAKYKATDYDKILENTNLNNLGEEFKNCDKKGINSLFMLALACHESNYGNSNLSIDKNNIFGYMAYDHDPYNSAKYFYSKEDCIDYVSDSLIKNYLSESGSFYQGNTISDINQNYATDSEWADKVYKIMEDLEKKLDTI